MDAAEGRGLCARALDDGFVPDRASAGRMRSRRRPGGWRAFVERGAARADGLDGRADAAGAAIRRRSGPRRGRWSCWPRAIRRSTIRWRCWSGATGGAISVYAQGRDYHDLVKKRLKRVGALAARAERRARRSRSSSTPRR